MSTIRLDHSQPQNWYLRDDSHASTTRRYEDLIIATRRRRIVVFAVILRQQARLVCWIALRETDHHQLCRTPTTEF